MNWSSALIVTALASTLMSSALAEEPVPVPPVVLPVAPVAPAPTTAPATPIAPAEPAVIPAAIPPTEPEATTALVVPAEQCDAMLQQVLAELDYWRSQGTPLPAPSAAVALPPAQAARLYARLSLLAITKEAP